MLRMLAVKEPVDPAYVVPLSLCYAGRYDV